MQFHELENETETIEYKGYCIDAFLVSHKVTCYGYNIRIERAGKFDPDKAKELEIPLMYWRRLQQGETVTDGDKVFSPELVMGPKRRGIKVTYCTDSRPVSRIAENASGADLFICEGMYGEEGKESKAREYKHMTMYEAAELAKKADVPEMWLTHYSPSLVRPDEYLDKVRAIFPNAKTPKDGWIKTLDFTD